MPGAVYTYLEHVSFYLKVLKAATPLVIYIIYIISEAITGRNIAEYPVTIFPGVINIRDIYNSD